MGIIDEIRKIIEDYFYNSTFTSANPTHTNVVRLVAYSYVPDERDLLEEGRPKEPTQPVPSGIQSLNIARQPSSVLNALKDPLGSLEKFVPFARLIPIIGTIIAAPEIIKRIADLLRDLLIIDIRFKRNIQGEVFQSLERQEKARIRQGLDIIRITSSKTLRGDIGIGHSGQVGITGIAAYDQDFEAFKKGVL